MFLPTNITLKFGDSGDFVSELQRRLSIVKCFNESAINGFYDGTTVNGVSQFQSMSGIQADGIAGPETLRRLNGALSGDTGGTADPQAEEAARQQAASAALLQQQLMIQQQQLLEQQQAQLQQQMAQQPHQFQPAVAPEAVVSATQSYEANPRPQSVDVAAPTAAQQQVQQQIMREQAMQQQMQHPAAQAPTAGDILAQMLMAQPQQAPAPAPQAQQTTGPTQQPRPIQQPGQAAEQPLRNVAAETQHNTQPQALAKIDVQQVPAAQEPRGIVGRATQFANEMIQKLSNYFEAKLPAPVLQEVKQIGQTMAKSGMQEVAIPTGPEQQRGTEQGRGQQQGRQIS